MALRASRGGKNVKTRKAAAAIPARSHPAATRLLEGRAGRGRYSQAEKNTKSAAAATCAAKKGGLAKGAGKAAESFASSGCAHRHPAATNMTAKKMAKRSAQ